MKSKEKFTHEEIMVALHGCLRELINTDIAHRNMPNIINRGKATSQVVNSIHREEIMELKRIELSQRIIDQQNIAKKIK